MQRPASVTSLGGTEMKSRDEGEDAIAAEDGSPVYPPIRTLVPVMAALYMAMFLVSLVRPKPRRAQPLSTRILTENIRTASSSQPRYPRSPTSLNPYKTLAGMVVPTSWPHAPPSSCSVGSIPSLTQRPSSWLPLFSLKSAQSSVVLLPTPLPSSLDDLLPEPGPLVSLPEPSSSQYHSYPWRSDQCIRAFSGPSLASLPSSGP